MSTNAINLALAGLDVTRARIDTLTRNITNANTPGYTTKTDTATTGEMGQVQLGSVTRSVDTAFGTPAASSSLSAQLTNLQSAFQDLSVNPEKTSLLNSVINAGDSVAR